MSGPDRQPSDAAVEAATKAILDEGGAPGHSIHSWRCEHPDRYGDCDCVQQTARTALEAAYRVDAPRPLLDREAVRSLFRGPNACGYWLENIMDDHEQEAATDAVMELARPMPTQAELTDWLRDIFVTDADPEGTSWGVAAELLLAQLNRTES